MPTDRTDAAPRAGRVLLTGWFSFLHGEATVGGLLSLDRVRGALDRRGIAYDTAWSGGFRPHGLRLDEADPGRYRAVVFVRGPLHGPQIEDPHRRFVSGGLPSSVRRAADLPAPPGPSGPPAAPAPPARRRCRSGAVPVARGPFPLSAGRGIGRTDRRGRSRHGRRCG